MKFEEEMRKVAFKLEKIHGFNVLQCIYNTENLDISEEELTFLEAAHYKKIELSDAIYVVDIQGYVGNQTSKEIYYAREKGKEIILHSNYSDE